MHATRGTRFCASAVLSVGLIIGFAVPAFAVQSTAVIASCEAFETAKQSDYSESSLDALSTAAGEAEVPPALLESITDGDGPTIEAFFEDGCLEPNNTTVAACGLYSGLLDNPEGEALRAQQLRFVLDNAASTIIAESLGELADPTATEDEREASRGRLGTVFDAACENVDAPAAGAAADATPTPAEPEATATPEADATATPEPEATATPEPETTATPEPSATPRPTATTPAGSGSSNESSSGSGSLPRTGADDVTFGLAKTATILVAAGLLFLGFEGRVFLARRRALATAAAAPTTPRATPKKPATPPSEPNLSGHRTLADYD